MAAWIGLHGRFAGQLANGRKGKMAMLERNYKRESMFARGSNPEWWSQSLGLFGIHVMTSPSDGGWQWKINGVSTWNSSTSFGDREAAYQDALRFARELLEDDLAVVKKQ